VDTFRGVFDRVLLDAPCSGLGTLRRNPEIRWRMSRADIKKCMETQKCLLRNAAENVRPGGSLVYSVWEYLCWTGDFALMFVV
jgi:16S rRNA (cytosine967-C5)-methyltransferase